MAGRRKQVSKKGQNNQAMLAVSVVLLILVLTVSVNNYLKNKRLEVYREKEQILIEQIEKENERTKDIEEYKKYTKTKKYIEEVAREKLGLVYEDEIIIKTDED